MNSYLVEAVVIRLAASLLGQKQVDKYFQYACLGALKRYRNLQTAKIEQTDGIDDMRDKADALSFGQRCGRFMSICQVPVDRNAQAAVIRGMFFTGPRIPPAEKVSRMLHALLLRAQLKIHTTKPGYEDIHRWLTDFNDVVCNVNLLVEKLSSAVCDDSQRNRQLTIFDRNDPIIARALSGKALSEKDAVPEARTAIGRCLAALCEKPNFDRKILKIAYHPSTDFPQRKAVDAAEMERICKEPILGRVDCNQPLIIERIEMRKCEPYTLLIVDTKAGVKGISIAHDNWKFFYPILEKKLAPYFIGKDAQDVERLFEEIYVQDLNYKIQGLAYWCCVSWLESALLDILGKAKGVAVGQLFGPKIRERVDYYCASGNRATTPQEELEILRERISSIGANAVKFKIGGRMSWDKDAMNNRSQEIIVLARRYFGDDTIIIADANGSFGPKTAIEYGRMLEDINAYFYEEPCRFDYLWENGQVAHSLTIPLAFGEQETSLRRYRYLIEEAGIGIIQPDINYLGGFIRTAKVAKMAELAGVTISAHLSGGPQHMDVLQLASFVPNMCRYQELKGGFDQAKECFTDEISISDGSVNIPKGVGLCMHFDDSFLRSGQTIFSVQAE